MFDGTIPSGTVIPRFSSSCFVEELTPSGHTVFVEVAGEIFFNSVCRANAEQVASGSAFWWQKIATLFEALTWETRDRRFEAQLDLTVSVDFRGLSLSCRGWKAGAFPAASLEAP